MLSQYFSETILDERKSPLAYLTFEQEKNQAHLHHRSNIKETGAARPPTCRSFLRQTSQQECGAQIRHCQCSASMARSQRLKTTGPRNGGSGCSNRYPQRASWSLLVWLWKWAGCHFTQSRHRTRVITVRSEDAASKINYLTDSIADCFRCCLRSRLPASAPGFGIPHFHA